MTGRIFLDQMIRDPLDLGRPDRISLVFDRRIIRRGKHATLGRFRTRVIPDGVTPGLHIDYKDSRIKQYHNLGKALRTKTTINDPRDFGVAKGLSHLPELKEIGFTPAGVCWTPNESATTPPKRRPGPPSPSWSSPGRHPHRRMPITSPCVQTSLAAQCALRYSPTVSPTATCASASRPCPGSIQRP